MKFNFKKQENDRKKILIVEDEPMSVMVIEKILKGYEFDLVIAVDGLDAIDKFKDFGGIRLEDDILITPEGSRFTGEKRIPITIKEVEAIMNE